MTTDRLKNRLTEEILVLDGAMGTMIMRRNLSEQDFRGMRFKEHPVPIKGCNDILVISRPEMIYDIHAAYLQAGADIVSTDTFNANRISLSAYGLSDYVSEICYRGASVARKAVDDFCEANAIPCSRRPFVAGSMGPTGVALSLSVEPDEEDMTFYNLSAAFVEQASALIKGGVDILLLETVFDMLNAEAAVAGIKKAYQNTGAEVPLVLSATVTPQGRLYSGQSISQFVDAFSHSGASVLGLNCSVGAGAMEKMISELSQLSPVFVSMHPNAGHPDATGCHNETPERMLNNIRPILKKGLVNIIGGCCGTTPDHIRLIAREAKRHFPRAVVNAE